MFLNLAQMVYILLGYCLLIDMKNLLLSSYNYVSLGFMINYKNLQLLYLPGEFNILSMCKEIISDNLISLAFCPKMKNFPHCYYIIFI